MSRTAIRRLILAGIALTLAAAVVLGAFRRNIDAPHAAAIAERMYVRYQHVAAEPPRHFGRREDRIWADGWEFRWRYLPCAQTASLRVWVSLDGRRARYAEVPECGGGPGAERSPVEV